MSKTCASAAACPFAPAQMTDGCPAAELCPSYCEPHGYGYSTTTRGTAPAAGRIIGIDENRPHKVSEVICVKCGRRWISVRPEGTLLKDLECPDCGAGWVIMTGEDME